MGNIKLILMLRGIKIPNKIPIISPGLFAYICSWAGLFGGLTVLGDIFSEGFIT